MATAQTNTIDSTGPGAEALRRTQMAVPHVILLGYGVTDSLQLTVESQRILARHGSACGVGLPANLVPSVAHVSRWYPEAHPATVIHRGAQGMKVASLPLGRLSAASGVEPGTHFFLDALRAPQPQEAPA